MPIQGSLEEFGVEDVVQLLELSRKTGELVLRSEVRDDEGTIAFDNGRVVGASRAGSRRTIGRQLLQAGKLTEREIDRALEAQRQDPSMLFGEILLEMGSITREALEEHLHFQLEETVYELMAWEDGRFRFEEKEQSEAVSVPIALRVDSLLMEGVRRIDEWSRLASKVPDTSSVPALARVADPDPAPLDLRPEDWEVIAEIDGERDIERLAGSLGWSGFDVAKTVYGLVGLGVVEVASHRRTRPRLDPVAALRELEDLLRAGSTDAALRFAHELQAAEPDRPEYLLAYGRTLASKQRMRAATEAFARACVLDPASVAAHHQLGLAAVRIGDLDRAAEAWRGFLELTQAGDPRRDRIMEALSALEALKRISNDESRERNGRESRRFAAME